MQHRENDPTRRMRGLAALDEDDEVGDVLHYLGREDPVTAACIVYRAAHAAALPNKLDRLVAVEIDSQPTPSPALLSATGL